MRLESSAIVPAERTVSFDYDGERVSALEGETIAAALAAAGRDIYRHTRAGNRRGLYCGMGSCFECLVSVDGRQGQRACMTKVADGMSVFAQDSERARACSLAPLASEPVDAAPREIAIDLLVVGAGPAGLAAACAARARGASVIVIDDRSMAGGQFFKQIAPSHRYERQPDRQFEQGAALIRRVRSMGVAIVPDALVWGVFGPREIGVIAAGEALLYRPRQLMLTPGAYEYTAPFPGWTLPGVMTTGGAQTLARAYRVAPGERIVIAGNGPLNLQLAVELLAGGANIVAVLDSAPRPGLAQWRPVLSALREAPGLIADGLAYLAKLRAARVPVLWDARVIAADGDPRIERITYVRETGTATLDCDTLCVGYGFAPATDIARALGCDHSFVDRNVGYLTTDIDADGRTSVPGVLAAGDGTRIGGARVALARGTLAGHAAADALGLPELSEPSISSRNSARRALTRATRFQQALWTLFEAPPIRIASLPRETVVCRCEEVTQGELLDQITSGYDTLASIKRNTRLGMGRCQGRNCAATCAKLVEELTGRKREVMHFLAPRVPIRPVPLAALAFEKPEWGGHRKAVTPNVARPVNEPKLTDQQTDVLVIGGGVMGACLSYFLSRAGRKVLVVDRDDLNLQASGANAGSLHVQLLSFDFGNKARAGGMPAASTLVLGPASVRLWQMLEAASGEDLEIRLTGGLMVADSEAGMRFLERKIALERSFGIEAELLDTRALLALSPNLAPTLLGAEFCPMEGKINPLRATYAVMRLATAQGARFQRATNVTAIARERDGFIVDTGRGRIRARTVVNAAGAWAKEIGAMLGVHVPVAGAPLQMIATEPAPKLVNHLIAHADRHLSLKQTETGGLLIGGGWTAAFDPARRINHAMRESIEGNVWVASHVLPALKGLHMVRAWAGMNIDIDGAPILGPVEHVPGFYNAVTSNGYTLAPIVSQLVADLILERPAEFDVTPFLIDRFALA
ncbi:FAD-dependent oxidoreductase [Caballeronia sp. SEWSISQ10-4 2]|uniref:FAD-dependent oxidoreductase n=1 Tax=Caballeronia sp. SEWSISQ10-4 2 TaxID=2937438 RepID=UPI00264F3921|nr:FAD-dependent oxidoreductase [Caballeronia sp. SEWSISQ10-4 2]MDN7183484.1 FAD-dependent oxidoreductase [Caballeronia sp. SEWSISQ10-4 2]